MRTRRDYDVKAEMGEAVWNFGASAERWVSSRKFGALLGGRGGGGGTGRENGVAAQGESRVFPSFATRGVGLGRRKNLKEVRESAKFFQEGREMVGGTESACCRPLLRKGCEQPAGCSLKKVKIRRCGC